MFAYLAICLTSVFAGKGLLDLIGLQLETRASIYLAPITTLIIWALLLGVGVSLGFPVKYLWCIGWFLTFVLASLGVRWLVLPSFTNEWTPFAVVVFVPVVLMAPWFWYGPATYLGSPLPDGWSYVAYGQYLWDYGRNVEGGLAPLYQYAAHLRRTRFIASALLGFFSPIVSPGGDTQAASGYVLAWAIFAYCSSCMFFALTKGLTRKASLVYISGSV